MLDVTAAIIEKNGLVLVARRKAEGMLGGFWEFPGGKIDGDETPEECLARELHEEFAIETKIGAFLGESVYDYSGKVVRLLAYRVEHVAGEFVLLDHDEICWLAPEQLDTLQWAPADIPLVHQLQAEISTAKYYKDAAACYCAETAQMQVSDLYKPFLSLLREKAHILDAGCGSGRDSRAFIDLGYRVTAIDVNESMASQASRLIGQPVKVMSFVELNDKAMFDGIWACASLLHCPRGQIRAALEHLLVSLKDRGVLYASFKWGTDETIDERGRFFNNYTCDSLSELLESFDVEIVDISERTSPLRCEEQRWVEALVRKHGSSSRSSFPKQDLMVGGEDPFLPSLLAAINHADTIDGDPGAVHMELFQWQDVLQYSERPKCLTE